MQQPRVILLVVCLTALGCNSVRNNTPTQIVCDGGGCVDRSTCSLTRCGNDLWPTEYQAREAVLLDQINQKRAGTQTCGGASMGPAEPLVSDPALNTAARFHSLGMLREDFFSHLWPDQDKFKTWRTPSQRSTLAGYTRGNAGYENIAAGYGTPEATVEGWMKSTEHCLNIMRASLKKAGVGYVKRSAEYPVADGVTRWPDYWTFVGGE